MRGRCGVDAGEILMICAREGTARDHRELRTHLRGVGEAYSLRFALKSGDGEDGPEDFSVPDLMTAWGHMQHSGLVEVADWPAGRDAPACDQGRAVGDGLADEAIDLGSLGLRDEWACTGARGWQGLRRWGWGWV